MIIRESIDDYTSYTQMASLHAPPHPPSEYMETP